MKTIKVTMYMEVEDDFVEDAKKWEHHVDYLIDTENYSEIEYVYDVSVEEV